MRRRFILFLVIVGFLIGCSGAEDAPAQGAREWIDGIANLDGNKMLKYTCLAQRESIQQASIWTSAFSVLGQMLTSKSVEIKGDISDLKFETIGQNGDQAEVRVYGELRVAVLGAAQANQVDERWQMIKENDTWRWCGTIATQPQSSSSLEAGNTVNGLKLETVDIRIDSNTAGLEAGWQRINTTLSAENITEFVGYYPSGFCGFLTDSGGYERKAWSDNFLTEDEQIIYALPPKTRVKGYTIVSVIPQNQSPRSLALYPTDWLTAGSFNACIAWKNPDNGPLWTLSDLENPVGDINYPYDSMPNIAPTVENGVFQYEEPGLYKIELSNCRFSNYFECDYKFENIGGYDLRLSDEGLNSDRVLRVLGATNTGRYIAGVIKTGKVSPGMSETGSVSIGDTFSGKSTKMLYLTLVPDGRNQPVAQMVFMSGKDAEPLSTSTPAPTTPTPLPKPSIPSAESLPQTWDGNWEGYRMILNIEKVDGNSFQGTLYWPTVIKVKTTVQGEFVQDFRGSDSARWEYIEGFNTDKSGSWLKFTETELLQGSNYQLNGRYYAHIEDDGKTMKGISFSPENPSTPNGSFTMTLQ